MGRNIGTMRLGGWYDFYLPEGVTAKVIPGQTLIGSETVLGTFGEIAHPARSEPESATQSSTMANADVEPDVDESSPEEDEESDALDALAGEEAADVDDDNTDKTHSDDVTEMFARLRKEARRVQDED